MTKLMTTLTISTIASILIIGGFATAIPNAFSTYGGGHHDDDDDCDNWNYGYYHNNDDDDDDCDNNPPKDPCGCEKPDTLKFKFSTPSEEINSEFKIEIYKKLNDIGNSNKKLMGIADVTNSLEDYQIEASSFGKDKLNSNTVFAIYKIVEDDDVLVSSMEIHTSCSKPLYKGMTVTDSGYSLEVSDGLKNGETSISESNPMTCGDEPEPIEMGRIVIRNALTVDNGGNAEFTDFTYKITNVDSGNSFDFIQDLDDPSLNEVEAPKGSYTLSQMVALEITESYTQVLITGDKKCPSTLNEPISIKKGKTISCTIYNDDNGDGVEEIEPGNIFHVGTVKFDINFPNTISRCDTTNTVLPCIFEDSNGLFNVVPNLKETETLQVSTLVLMNVIGLELGDTTMQDPLASSGCVFDGLTSFTSDTETLPAFKFQCSGLSSSSSEFRINYALIETLIPPNVL